MSLSINNNSSSLVALESLNAAQAELSKTENTISTGKKVDNAADSPAIYSIAAQMNGNLQGMGAVSDSLSLGAQVVATANTAGNKIMDSLQGLQATITTAGQTGTDASAMATQILNTLDSINSYARNATFSGVNLLTSGNDAVNAYNGTTLNTLVNVQGQTQTFSSVTGGKGTLVDTLGLTSDSAAGSTAAASTQKIFSSLTKDNVSHVDTSSLTTDSIHFGDGTNAGSTVTLDGTTFEFVATGTKASGTNTAVSLDAGFSIKTALTALVSAANGAGVAASLDSDNSLSVAGASADVKTAASTVATYALTSTDLSSKVALASTSTAADGVTIGSVKYSFVDSSITDSTSLPAESATAKNIKLQSGSTVADALKALDKAVGDKTAFSFDGTNINTGDTATTFTFSNVKDDTDKTKTIATATSSTKPTLTASAGTAKDQIAVGIKGGVTSAVASLQSAITNMSSVMQTVGNYSNSLSGMTTYTKSLTDAVTNGVSALTDADMAAASAKLTSLQTKQSLAIKSLTIANGQSQNILSLFQG